MNVEHNLAEVGNCAVEKGSELIMYDSFGMNFIDLSICYVFKCQTMLSEGK